MESIIDFFTNLTTVQKLIWVTAVISITLLIELVSPLTKLVYDKSKLKHAGVNFVFLACTFIINFLFGLATVGLFAWTAANQFGVLYLVDLPIWAELAIAFLFFDFFAQYLAHYVLHNVNRLWRFHLIHHSDTKVDATTGTRHHPGDYVVRELFSTFVIVLTGAPLGFYLFYRMSTVFFTYTSHANWNVPHWLDKPLSYLFVTPHTHKFHHHANRPWTDSNYGNILSIWDRMFGTFVYENVKDINYGLDVMDGSKDEDLAYQFMTPFRNDGRQGRIDP